MRNAADSKETNKPTIESPTGLAPQERARGHKRSLSSFFRSLSGSSRAGRSSDSDALEDGLIPVRRRSTIRKNRHSRHTPASLSQSAIDLANSQFDRQRMLRLSRYPQSPPSPYQTIPEDDAPSIPLPPSTHGSRAPTPRPPPSPSALSMHSAPGLPDISPPSALSVPGHQDNEEHPGLSSPLASSMHLNHTRRKASMSKLMRHFGETRIPPELVLPTDQPEDQDISEQENVPLRKQRTKSLDLRPFAKTLQVPESYGLPPTPRRPLSRTRSLGQRSAGLGGRRSIDDKPLAEAAQDRVRRARKIAQIFGPDLPYELIVNTEQIQSRKSMDAPIGQLTPVEPNVSDPALTGKPSLERASSESTTESPDKRDPFIGPTAPSIQTEEAEHRRRTQKLAKFFGVSQHDISSSVSSEPVVKAPSLPASGVTAEAPPVPLPLQEVEVNVKLTGRRFWGFSSPNRPQYRHVETNDAIVIDQLRTLKAS